MKRIVLFILIISLLIQTLPLSSVVLAKEDNFTYDSSGNLTYDGQRTITYNASGMPTKIELIGKGIEASFVYDGAGQRIAKIVKDSTDKPVSVTIYLGNIEKEIIYSSAGGQSVSTNFNQFQPVSINIIKYYFANGKRIALRKNNGPPLFIHADHLSSSTLFTDNSANKIDFSCHGYEPQNLYNYLSKISS